MLARNECMTFGTTEAMITSSTSCGSKPLSARNWVIISPYSSEVWFDLVVMRYVPTMSSPSKKPRTMFVLPISTAMSMIPP